MSAPRKRKDADGLYFNPAYIPAHNESSTDDDHYYASADKGRPGGADGGLTYATPVPAPARAYARPAAPQSAGRTLGRLRRAAVLAILVATVAIALAAAALAASSSASGEGDGAAAAASMPRDEYDRLLALANGSRLAHLQRRATSLRDELRAAQTAAAALVLQRENLQRNASFFEASLARLQNTTHAQNASVSAAAAELAAAARNANAALANVRATRDALAARQNDTGTTHALAVLLADLGPRATALELATLFLQQHNGAAELVLTGSRLWLDTCPQNDRPLSAGTLPELEADLSAGQRLLHVALNTGLQDGTIEHDRALGIATATNAVYFVGTTQGRLEGETAHGGIDAYIARMDPSGFVRWARQLGTAGDDEATCVVVEGSSGAIFMGGTTPLAFPGEVTAGGQDAFLARYSSAGQRQWLRQFGSNNFDRIADIAANDAAVYVAGSAFGALPENGPQGAEDAFLAAYGHNGDRLWIEQFGTTANDALFGIALSPTAIFVAGKASNDFAGQPHVAQSDVMVARFRLDGLEEWVRLLGSSGPDIGRSIAVSGSTLYIAGVAGAPLPGSSTAGGHDMFVASYNTRGDHLWTTQLGSSGHDEALAVVVAENGDPLVAGYIEGLVQGMGPGQRHAGLRDAAVVRLDRTSGAYVRSRVLGTEMNDEARAMALMNERVYIAGHTSGALFRRKVSTSDVMVVALNTSGNACAV